MKKKNEKITKRAHALKGYASTYNVGILNSFNPELKFKDIESAIKIKLKKTLSELRGLQFVAALVLVIER